MKDEFDISKADAQGTSVQPLSINDFDFAAYGDYADQLDEGCSQFQSSSSGVSVYRRFRVPEVFSWGCRDKKLSLEWQLAALTQSMNYKADIPNFLEPWYGIGVISSAFGIPYLWKDGQSPAVESPYKNAAEAMSHLECSVAESPVGKEVLNRIDYFLESTKGRVPMSLTDTQSPLNIASSYLLDPSTFIYETFDHPEDVKKMMAVIADLEKEFIQTQMDLIGDALANPGHGFASSRKFKGLGFSDDNVLMFGDEDYQNYAMGPLCDVASLKNGPVFHSCGDWADRSELVKSIPGLVMADAAVGNQTDPSPNDPEVLGKAFSTSDATLHIRVVGDSTIVEDAIKKVWQPGLKLIVATYCESSSEQLKTYNMIHNICK